jgi:hypothetical protein
VRPHTGVAFAGISWQPIQRCSTGCATTSPWPSCRRFPTFHLRSVTTLPSTCRPSFTCATTGGARLESFGSQIDSNTRICSFLCQDPTSYALSIGSDDDFAIIGAYAMQGQVWMSTFCASPPLIPAQEVIFDRANSRVGFARASAPC